MDKARIRKDLLEEGLSVPINVEKGETIYIDTPDAILCRWVGEDEEDLQVFWNGEWMDAYSIDFEFD